MRRHTSPRALTAGLSKIGVLAAALAIPLTLMGAPAAGASAPAPAQASSVAPQQVEAAASLTATNWYNEGISRYVTVRNTYSSARCFRVDVPFRADPMFKIAGNSTKSFNYGGTAYFKGRGIYQESC